MNNYIFDGKKMQHLIIDKASTIYKSKSEIKSIIKNSLGISKQTISNWIKGKNQPSIDNLFWLKEFFHLGSIDNFFKKEG